MPNSTKPSIPLGTTSTTVHGDCLMTLIKIQFFKIHLHLQKLETFINLNVFYFQKMCLKILVIANATEDSFMGLLTQKKFEPLQIPKKNVQFSSLGYVNQIGQKQQRRSQRTASCCDSCSTAGWSQQQPTACLTCRENS